MATNKPWFSGGYCICWQENDVEPEEFHDGLKPPTANNYCVFRRTKIVKDHEKSQLPHNCLDVATRIGRFTQRHNYLPESRRVAGWQPAVRGWFSPRPKDTKVSSRHDRPIWYPQLGRSRSRGLPDHSGLWGFARAVRMEYPGFQFMWKWLGLKMIAILVRMLGKMMINSCLQTTQI